MPLRSVAFVLLCCQHLPGVGAWSASTRGGGVGSSVTRYGGLLANLGSWCSSSLLARADDGECAVTPEIPALTSSTAAAAASAVATSLSRKPIAGDIVTFTLLRFEPNGDDGPLVLEPLFDTSGTLQLVLDGGNYLPGLHKLLSTMDPGETIRGATIDAGYGAYNPELVFQISTSDVGDSLDTSLVKIGTLLRMGNGMECRVTEITEESWTLDANHALAGASYDVDVRLDKVEEGPQKWEYVDNESKAQVGPYQVATFALGCFWGGGEDRACM